MTIAEKLQTIAENEQKVYDKGVSKMRSLANRTITEVKATDLEGITEIGDYGFYACKSLTSLELPEGIECIGTAAFNSCWNLNQVLTLPSTVTNIGTNAFRYCSGIKQIISKATTPPTLGAANAIQTTSELSKIIVPMGCGEAYRTATNWSDYADIIEEGEV